MNSLVCFLSSESANDFQWLVVLEGLKKNKLIQQILETPAITILRTTH